MLRNDKSKFTFPIDMSMRYIQIFLESFINAFWFTYFHLSLKILMWMMMMMNAVPRTIYVMHILEKKFFLFVDLKFKENLKEN